ncbi:hypothetical protein [Gryllotalpicola koreensis]|uniref:Rod shape-determining protein MreD n=1 Tax=Gryllotalpicola koreensis TaxID=993086 RepID=A0ABP7ZXN8_9MICO
MRGRELPAWAVRAVLGVLLLALAALHAGDAWGWIAALAGVAAAVSPWLQLAWVAMLSLVLSELIQPAGAGAWHPYTVLAGVALAHVLAARAAVTPVRARVELRVFARPLLIAAAVTAPSEGLLALTLWLRGAALPSWVPATVVGAAALLALGALLFGRLLRRA